MNHSLPSNKQVVECLYRDCINGSQLELIEELIHPDFIGSRGEKGTSGFAQTLSMVRTGFPDLRFTIEDLIAEGDRVVARWKMEGTRIAVPSQALPQAARKLRKVRLSSMRPETESWHAPGSRMIDSAFCSRSARYPR